MVKRCSASSGAFGTPNVSSPSTPITTDVDFRLDGLGEVGPASASRSDYLGHLQPMSLLTLYFWFHTGLQPGETSRFVYVSTNATDFSRYRGFALVGEEPTWGNPQWHATASVLRLRASPNRTTNRAGSTRPRGQSVRRAPEPERLTWATGRRGVDGAAPTLSVPTAFRGSREGKCPVFQCVLCMEFGPGKRRAREVTTRFLSPPWCNRPAELGGDRNHQWLLSISDPTDNRTSTEIVATPNGQILHLDAPRAPLALVDTSFGSCAAARGVACSGKVCRIMQSYASCSQHSFVAAGSLAIGGRASSSAAGPPETVSSVAACP